MHFGAMALPAKVWMPKEEKGAGFALSLRAISWPFPVEPYSSPRNGRGNSRERAKPKEEAPFEAPFSGVSSFGFALSLRAISWPFPVEPNSSPRNGRGNGRKGKGKEAPPNSGGPGGCEVQGNHWKRLMKKLNNHRLFTHDLQIAPEYLEYS